MCTTPEDIYCCSSRSIALRVWSVTLGHLEAEYSPFAHEVDPMSAQVTDKNGERLPVTQSQGFRATQPQMFLGYPVPSA